jgi:hypothetical protein
MFSIHLRIPNPLIIGSEKSNFELTTGQSIGKKLLNLRTTNLSGTGIDLKTALIESFGKAFLLPLDILLGWIFTNDRRALLS